MTSLSQSSHATALVTAGGTSQYIDDVRKVTNISNCSFGIEIARKLSRQGIETTLLGSPACMSRLNDREPFAVREFDTFSQLQAALNQVLTTPPTFVFHAASVSDYSPVQTSGKISSDLDKMSIEFIKNPKLIASFREQCGHASFLIGFKLLSGVSPEELKSAALKQVKGHRLNLTVAKDLKQLRPKEGWHPIYLTTPEGGFIPVIGHRSEVAAQLVDFAMKRNDVQWFHTNRVSVGGFEIPGGLAEAAHKLLAVAQNAQLLTDTNGNVSFRGPAVPAATVSFAVSPRQLDKGQIAKEDLCAVQVDPTRKEILCIGPHKSSIDSGVQGLLYQELPHIEALLHFHQGQALVIPDGCTHQPFPCGTVEEAEEILQTIHQGRKTLTPFGPDTFRSPAHKESFLLELAHHGYLLGLEQGATESFTARWNSLCQMHHEHLHEIGRSETIEQLNLAPALLGPEIIGVIGKHPEGWHTLWLDPFWRRKGFGENLIQEMTTRGYTVGVDRECHAVEAYLKRGFQIVEEKGTLSILLPPTRRSDLRRAATIALVNPETEQVLIGKRTAGSAWPGYYCFPGGGIEPTERAEDAAWRELGEETGISAPHLKPISSFNFYTGWNRGELAYHVNAQVCLTYRHHEPKITTELDARWYSLAEAINLAPMAYGSKFTLRKIMALRDAGWKAS